jgi:methionine-rich copper-binding protein CopC
MRKVTHTTVAANVVTDMTGRGWMKFNDKLKDGRRSLKVFGWKLEDYKLARDILERAGQEAEIVTVSGYCARANRSYTQNRLHVREQ